MTENKKIKKKGQKEKPFSPISFEKLPKVKDQFSSKGFVKNKENKSE